MKHDNINLLKKILIMVGIVSLMSSFSYKSINDIRGLYIDGTYNNYRLKTYIYIKKIYGTNEKYRISWSNKSEAIANREGRRLICTAGEYKIIFRFSPDYRRITTIINNNKIEYEKKDNIKHILYSFYSDRPYEIDYTLRKGLTVKRINPNAHGDIIILGIDEETIVDFAQKKIYWPFSKKIHSRFINFVTTGKPSVIYMDLLFLNNKKENHIFSRSLNSSGLVVLPMVIEKYSTYIPKKYSYLKRLHHSKRFRINNIINNQNILLPPSVMQLKSNAFFAPRMIVPDEDHSVRKIPLVISTNNGTYPSAFLAIVMKYYQISLKNIVIKKGKYIKLRNIKHKTKKRAIRIPIDEKYNMYINYIGGSGSFTTFPYHYFNQQGSVNKDNTSLKGKIFLTGAIAQTGIARDIHQTPWRKKMFSIEIIANAINTIITQKFVTPEK